MLPRYLKELGFDLINLGERNWTFSYKGVRHHYDYKSKRDAYSMILEWSEDLGGLETILDIPQKITSSSIFS